MAITSEHEAAETAMRDLLSEGGLPAPDEVEYRERSIVLLWHETKLAVVVDLDDPPAGESGPAP
ncbi:MAG: hypothetical protein QOI68_5811 [Pseudonocardiales bacterium]|jgi:hypothetical protein|nr:hypothetical protein [Pseudonocardiales bacterium]